MIIDVCVLYYGWRTARFDFWEVVLVVRDWPEIHADTKTRLHADCTDDVLEENMVKGSIILALLCPQFPKIPYGYFANNWSDLFWFLLWRECASRDSLNFIQLSLWAHGHGGSNLNRRWGLLYCLDWYILICGLCACIKYATPWSTFWATNRTLCIPIEAPQ